MATAINCNAEYIFQFDYDIKIFKKSHNLWICLSLFKKNKILRAKYLCCT